MNKVGIGVGVTSLCLKRPESTFHSTGLKAAFKKKNCLKC